MSTTTGSDGGDGAGHDGRGGHDDFLIVGLGASAGGIKAFKEFFAGVPARSGMAYVVILHLSPEHESRLAEVLQVSAKVPVTQVSESVRIEPDHVYVIPPNQSLSMVDSTLQLSDVTRIEERRAPVDIFFRTLGESHHARAVCVVLSGTGADGSMGLKRVKECGGLAIVQDPVEAEYADMPRHSIATALVDYVLPAAEMPAKIISYKEHLKTINLPTDAGDHAATDQQALVHIFTQMRMRTGHDFSNYKRATVLRRIERRLGVNELTDLPAYAAFLRANPDEARALLKDLLISVTNFYRDPRTFEALARGVVPKLFEGKGAGEQLRVWVAGCATGEEAYSVAMLLCEHAQTLPQPPSLQVFATDIDEDAIATAREGYYTLNDAADVSPERLRRFFTKDREGFRVRRELREMVLFAHHNLIKDPPFSHLDLISCRNLLIYLNRSAQEQIMNTFHFALRPGGFLLLGGSEATGEPDLFVPIDKANHIFQARATTTQLAPHLTTPPPSARAAAVRATREESAVQELRAQERLSYLDLHQRLLEEYGPPSVLVNENHEIVHLSERAGRFMQVAGGEPTRDLLRLVRPELRIELRSALFQAAQRRTNVEAPGLRVHSDDGAAAINLIVRPVLREEDTARGFFLVLFEEAREDGAGRSEPAGELVRAVEPAARQLEDELVHLKAQLRSTVEQYEVQHEELRASNEELQAVNEELRSAAEELETSKEELQSVNEELTTVNQELKIKIEELSQANNDFQNLMNSTDIGTLFLDRSLRVKLFTPRARDIFNLIPSDAGRSLLDLTNRLADDELIADIEHVLDRLQPVEREVRARDGRWYLMTMLPYRTTEDRIEGVVITFVDISRRKSAEARIIESEQRLHLLVESVRDYAIFAMTTDGHIEYWNAGAQRVFGFGEEEIVGRPGAIIFTPEDRERGVPQQEIETARREGRAADERWHVRKDGTRFYASGVMTAIEQDGRVRGFAKIARDLTSQQQSAEELRRAHDELETRVGERTEELRQTVESMLLEVKERSAAEVRAKGLVGQLVTAQEDERRRISRDLHDQLGQQLTALRLKLEALREQSRDREQMREQVEELQDLASRIDSEVDFLAWELRPSALDDLGLATTLVNFAEEWSKHYNIPAEVHVAGMEGARVAPQTETCLYRITQEALNNIYKYAQAARVNVVLERRDGSAVLVIEDDGVGFDLNEAMAGGGGRGLGLVGMRERAALLGGSLEIETAPGKGTTIYARVPVAPPEGGVQ
ncbi:MAG: CheR family methyltransferase [Pyrinomonadaceae bacterium]